MSKGLLISIEGPDGAGKTSVLKVLLPRLREVYPAQVITTREPGGVAIAEQIREVILDIDNTAMDAKTELLLYIAARRQHLVEKVLPELENGNMVIMDRFIDSSVAYQGAGRGLDQDRQAQLGLRMRKGCTTDSLCVVVEVFPWTLQTCFQISGGNGKEATPVPIPNTAVKLFRVDNTWLATAREDRSLPDSIFKQKARRWPCFLHCIPRGEYGIMGRKLR